MPKSFTPATRRGGNTMAAYRSTWANGGHSIAVPHRGQQRRKQWASTSSVARHTLLYPLTARLATLAQTRASRRSTWRFWREHRGYFCWVTTCKKRAANRTGLAITPDHSSVPAHMHYSESPLMTQPTRSPEWAVGWSVQ